MATPSLRPLGIGETLDAGINVCLRHWRVLLVCVLVFVVPLAIVDVLVTASVDPEQLRLGADSFSDGGDASRAGQVIVRLLEVVTVVLAMTAGFRADSDAWLSRPPAVGVTLRHWLRRVPAVLGLFGLIWLMVVAGVLLVALFAVATGFIAVLVGIPVLIGYIWMLPIAVVSLTLVVLEGLGPVRAWRRARHLVRARWWATLGTLLFGGLLTLFLQFMIGFVVGAAIALATHSRGTSELVGAFAVALITTLTYAISVPYSSALAVIVYYDRRVRREGLDLQLELESLAPVEAPEQVPAGEPGAA